MNENEVAAPKDALVFDLLPAVAAPGKDLVETPKAFLKSVSAWLKLSEDVDADLAAILSDHLLTVTPNADAVVNAKAAILALAAKRAAPAEEHVDG